MIMKILKKYQDLHMQIMYHILNTMDMKIIEDGTTTVSEVLAVTVGDEE